MTQRIHEADCTRDISTVRLSCCIVSSVSRKERKSGGLVAFPGSRDCASNNDARVNFSRLARGRSDYSLDVGEFSHRLHVARNISRTRSVSRYPLFLVRGHATVRIAEWVTRSHGLVSVDARERRVAWTAAATTVRWLFGNTGMGQLTKAGLVLYPETTWKPGRPVETR